MQFLCIYDKIINMEKLKHVVHPINPIYNKYSKVLILGSIPSPKSREVGMFYGHPKNRFWKVLAILFKEEEPTTNEERVAFLLKHNIAVWDVVKECDIIGASDSSIKNVVVNDFSIIKNNTNIKAVFTTGKTAFNLYKKYVGNDVFYLPSTSPANCANSLQCLVEGYSVLLKYL